MYLQLDSLCKSFAGRPVVRDLHLGLDKGKILCLLGPSGCGKTTTLRMIAGLLPCDGGTVSIDGQDITRLPPERRPVATVFQSYALFPNMTVAGNVAYGLRLRKVPRRQAERQALEYLEIAGLAEYANARVFEISGGQQQRVALMRALIVKPKVVLLDEPLSNLDAKLRIKMRVELKELRDRFDLTMVFVTHDREEAMVIADAVAVMNEGRIVQSGPPQQLYSHPQSRFVMEFFGQANRVPVGEGAFLDLRPEDLFFSAQGFLEGTVLRQDFYGFYREYLVRTAQGDMTVLAGKDEVYRAGEQVRLDVKRENALAGAGAPDGHAGRKEESQC